MKQVFKSLFYNKNLNEKIKKSTIFNAFPIKLRIGHDVTKSLFLGWIKARLEFYKKEIIIKIIRKKSATSRPCNISFNKI